MACEFPQWGRTLQSAIPGYLLYSIKGTNFIIFIEEPNSLGVDEWLVVIEPFSNGLVLVRIKVHLDRLQWLDIQNVVGVVQRWFLIVERWKTHPLEVPPIALLTSHHYPH